MAIEEAQRCLNCKHKPCVSGCPVNVKIPEFISLISEGKFEDAYNKILETNSLPAVCGRVCPQESQCEEKCVRAIKGESVAIGRLERFAADWAINNVEKTYEKVPSNGKKVAIIGSGPSGLACAGDLVKQGYQVTIFEAFHLAGGVLVYGIPEFRLPKSLVQKEIEGLLRQGVQIRTNMVIGKVLTIEELFEEGYDAVFIGSGAGLPSFMNIPGENLNGVYSANGLTRINLMKAYKEDAETPLCMEMPWLLSEAKRGYGCARCAKRLGAENVYIIYRRSEAEMPARLKKFIMQRKRALYLKFSQILLKFSAMKRAGLRELSVSRWN